MRNPLSPGALSPTVVRAAPFIVVAAITLAQGQLGAASSYWLYLLKTVIGALLVWVMFSRVPELRWAFSWAAVAVGVGVFVLWVGIDGPFMRIGLKASEWNPFREFGEGSRLGWFFVLVRLAGSTIVVPPVEEIFYRSFLYRYIQNADFESVPLRRFHWKAFVFTAFIFGIGHREWLAGVLCGCAYQWLVCRRGRMGDALLAHALTNLLLGLWVIGAGDWRFW